MDIYYSKRTVGGIAAPKKRPVTALKDSTGSRDQAPQFCNRIGCCGRLNHTKGTKNKCIEKPKPLKPPFRSSSSKEVIASSSKKPPSKPSSVTTESSSVSDESEIRQLNGSGSRPDRKLKSQNTEVGPSRAGIRKMSSEKLVVTNRASRSGSSKPEITENSERSRYGLRSLKCNSVSDVYKQGDNNNSNELNNGRRRRFFQGESSNSVKGKRVIGVAANESGNAVSDPRNLRNLTACRTSSVSSVRTRRSLNVETSRGSLNKSPVTPETSHSETLSLTESSESSDTSLTTISVSSVDHPIVRFMNHNGTQARHYNIDGIADVLLALDRIEQDEELTYEQLLSLEANLFLGGLNLYDQHRDMRLDIDNMSYEELLELEEKMGTVSTALSEEELSKCIRTSIYEYESLQLEDGRMRCIQGAADSKCSVCQEEFVRGDQIGRLGCGHGYHNPCINQWLRVKNRCPICKASPESSSSP